jgi:tRNA G18 (ribose-2'-O)-methylase SpoU
MGKTKQKSSGSMGRIEVLAAEAGLTVEYLSKHVLNTLADQRPHQGVIADCDALEFKPMDVLPTAEEMMAARPGKPAPVWLAMDQVSDPVRAATVVARSLVGWLAAVVFLFRGK